MVRVPAFCALSYRVADNMPIITEFAAPEQPPRGLTPPVLSGSVHAVRSLAQLRSKDKDIEKYIFLQQLKDADHNVFYHICLNNMSVSQSATKLRVSMH